MDQLPPTEKVRVDSDIEFCGHGSRSVAAVSRWTDAGFMDLVKSGQYQFYTGRRVPSRSTIGTRRNDRGLPEATSDAFGRRKRKLGGWPTIDGTRVPFDIVADALSGDLPLSSDQVQAFYPGVSRTRARRSSTLPACLLKRRYASIVAIARSLASIRLAARRYDQAHASVATPPDALIALLAVGTKSP